MALLGFRFFSFAYPHPSTRRYIAEDCSSLLFQCWRGFSFIGQAFAAPRYIASAWRRGMESCTTASRWVRGFAPCRARFFLFFVLLVPLLLILLYSTRLLHCMCCVMRTHPMLLSQSMVRTAPAITEVLRMTIGREIECVARCWA